MIGQHLLINAERYSAQTALVFGNRHQSYKELNERACRAANALAGMGIRSGDRVATLLNNCPACIELFFATAKIGAILVPINFRLTAREVRFALNNCTPKALFAGRSLQAIMQELAGGDAMPEALIWVADRIALQEQDGDDYEKWLAATSAEEPSGSGTLFDPHLFVHSSGTTGFPKAAIWTQSTTLHSSTAKIIDFSIVPSDKTAVFGPLFHVGPLMDVAIPLLLRGGTLIIGETSGFDPRKVLQMAADEGVTILTIYPTMWRRVIREVDASAFDLSSLRMLLTGGEPMPAPLLQQVYDRFPGAEFVNTYGSTEGGPVTTFLAPADNRRKIGSIGKAAFGVAIKIVDTSFEEVPRGHVGELLVRSPFICSGYWNQPDTTAHSMRDGWWRTGDLVSQDADGFLWIEGRQKDMIISGAENIYPIEIEKVIGALEGVIEVSVVGVPDETWGEAVAAFVVKAQNSELDASRIIEHCKFHLASYKKPKHVRFVESLPRTTVNKVSKAILRAQFE